VSVWTRLVLRDECGVYSWLRIGSFARGNSPRILRNEATDECMLVRRLKRPKDGVFVVYVERHK
jgi:hypothetical protein